MFSELPVNHLKFRCLTYIGILRFFSSLHPTLFNPLNAKFTKWPNTLKQFVGKLPTNCFECVWLFCAIGA